MSDYASLLISLAGAGFLFMKMKGMRLDKAGIDLIKKFEGWSATVYQDQAGHDTIGYGHLIKPGEHFTYLTKPEGEILLRKDLQIYEKAVNASVKVKLTQSMYNSIVSLVYNIGVSAFKNSTLLKKLNSGDYEGAKNEFQRWNKITVNGEKIASAGLTQRRHIEAGEFFA